MAMSDAQAIEITITHRVRAHPIAGHHGHQTAGQAVLTVVASVVDVRPATGNTNVTLRSDDT